MKRLSDAWLEKFSIWFASDGGVWETFLVTLAVVIFEQIFPHFDPDHFLVLYALTVYSGITQPALAYNSRRDAERAAARLEAAIAELRALHAGEDRIIADIEKRRRK